eukprot:04754.XXX_37581_39558_1 [CDS] Oithona nana genome sequencing.
MSPLKQFNGQAKPSRGRRRSKGYRHRSPRPKTQTIRLGSSHGEAQQPYNRILNFDKENQSSTNEAETLCDPGFGTVWPSSLLFSSSSNFAASPIPLPSFVSPNPPPTLALSSATVPNNNVASVASKATFEEWKICNGHESHQLPPEEPSLTLDLHQGVFKANVYEPGYVSFMLKNDIVVNIGPNYAVQIVNPTVDIKLALSGCATQMALIHPQGRVLQYMARVEVQCLGSNGVDKSAKLWPRGISFTSSNCAITYLVDEAGTRSTSDYFYNLFFEDNTDTLFSKSCSMFDEAFPGIGSIGKSMQILETVEHWQTKDKTNVWRIDDSCIIQQTDDGYVSVERKYGNELFTLKTSPSNGKTRMSSSFLYTTASIGPDSHLFVKSNNKRIHSSENGFVVRNSGHSAGFDETDKLRIY